MVNAGLSEEPESGNKLPVLQTATALAVSFLICKTATILTKYFGIQGGSLPAITAIVVVLATAFPNQFAYLAPSGEAMALILMQVKITILLIYCPIYLKNLAKLLFGVRCFLLWLVQVGASGML